jgi:DNA-binding CsgD family transcriptional regulator/ligand-binding sensor protein
MSKQQYVTSMVLAKLQHLQDTLSKHHRLSISLVDMDAEKATISSNQNPCCNRCSESNEELCKKYHKRLIEQANNRKSSVIAPCPLGLQVAVVPLGNSLYIESFTGKNYFLILCSSEEMKISSIENTLFGGNGISAEQNGFREDVSLVASSFDLIFDLVQMNHILLEPNPPVSNDDFKNLTKREQEILHLVSSGMTNQEIACQLVISETTVKTHISKILKKLQMNNRTQLALYEIQAM